MNVLDKDGLTLIESIIEDTYAKKSYVDAADGLKAPINSPAFTGEPTAPTVSTSDNSTKIATTEYVTGHVSSKLFDVWKPTTAYSVGNTVKTPSLPSQYCLVCTTAGTSGASEPSYSGVSLGDSVTDGSVVWNVEGTTMATNRVLSLPTQTIFDLTNTTEFQYLTGTITIVGGHLAVLDMQVIVKKDLTDGTKYYTSIGTLKKYKPKVTTVNLEVRVENAYGDSYNSGFDAYKAILSKGYPNDSNPHIFIVAEPPLYIGEKVHISGMWYV